MSRTQKLVLPDTQRMVEGFRDTGYTFNAAVADIVDNSIAAGATHVGISVFLDSDGAPHVWIADNGQGMNSDDLENAMRYGSRRREDPHSLGRFGLGLKTASTSFCKRLTVISRTSGSELVSATWDLDVIADRGEWYLDTGLATSEESTIFEEACADPDHGTVVVWDEVDRLLKTKAGADAKNKPLIVKRLVEDLDNHLGMVFQRFLDTRDGRAPAVAMTLNDEPIIHWDPFCEGRGGVEEDSQTWEFTHEEQGINEAVVLRAFILPRPEEFETAADRQYARITNRNQGIYLYRENRLIEGPSWLGIGAADTHLNNLRVELSFPAPLDEIFGVGIRKSGVHVDQSLMSDIDGVLQPVRREANRRSRKGRPAIDQNRPSPTENTIDRNLQSLDLPKVVSDDEGGIALENNQGTIPLKDKTGRSLQVIRLHEDEGDGGNVVHRETLQDGVLWLPSLSQRKIQLQLNIGHDWYRKAYLPNADNSPLVQAIDYLLFALAQAEMNNTSSENDEVFEEFRVEVSRNLRKLVRDLPEPDEP